MMLQCSTEMMVFRLYSLQAGSVDEEVARAQIAGLRRAAQSLGLRDDLSASSLLALPDVVRKLE